MVFQKKRNELQNETQVRIIKPAYFEVVKGLILLRDYHVHLRLSWNRPGLHFKNGIMHLSIYLSCLTSDSRKCYPSLSYKVNLVFSALIGDSVGVLTRGVELHCVSTSGVQPCPLTITNMASGQSLQAKAVIPDIPLVPWTSSL